MAKTVFVVEAVVEEIEHFLAELPVTQYTVVRVDSDNLSREIASHLVIEKGELRPFVFVVETGAFFSEEENGQIGLLVAARGVRGDPTFLVVGDAFSLSEVERILQRGNLFFLDRSQGQEDAAGDRGNSLRFRAALDKAFLDYEYNQRLVAYIAEDLESFVEQERLRSSKEVVEQLNQELEQKNRIDELTQLLNRKGIIESLQVAKGRAHRERWRLNGREEPPEVEEVEGDIEEFFGHLACMMIDIDDFKRINDTYGHLVGDEVLRTLGQLFHADGIFRQEDICGRYGGEEFIVILPATGAANALHPAEKFRLAVKDVVFRTDSHEEFSATVSVGIAELVEARESIDRLISRADAALYRAKQTGKDRTVIFHPDDFSSEDLTAAASRHEGGEIEELTFED
jgi:diguanylate cyclase (GGDEF)-like protein